MARHGGGRGSGGGRILIRLRAEWALIRQTWRDGNWETRGNIIASLTMTAGFAALGGFYLFLIVREVVTWLF